MPGGRYTHGYSSTLSAEEIALNNLEPETPQPDTLGPWDPPDDIAAAAAQRILDREQEVLTAPGRTTYVYQLHDRRGRLIYVGCTYHLNRRINWHHANQPWSDEIADVTHETFPNRYAAQQRESELIRRHRPVHNVQHPGSSRSRRRLLERIAAQA